MASSANKTTFNQSQLVYDSANINSSLVISGLTPSTSIATGALQVKGGAGIVSTLCVGGQILAASGFYSSGPSTVTSSLTTQGIFWENALAVTSGGGTNYYINYATGGIFYIPSTNLPTGNFSLSIIGVPDDTTKVYTVTLMYYQSSTKYYASTVNACDPTANYLWGSASTFIAPLFNGGAPTISNNPCMIIQQFNIISIGSSRYVTSSVSVCY